MGVPEVPMESLITEYSRMRWRKNLAPDANPVECQMGKMGTVGAVAVDSEGVVACATSTGGMLNKMEGRVGDTPCIGQSSNIQRGMICLIIKVFVEERHTKDT
ncbi:isoaspartyl peptidase/L-asparaginase-like [Labrus mixtus]|uniref:isoaspartyl peptidase/L-asparaginase-like n=1 Tax=Labrus mixtus TaxID=508554 RepID=UPI0029BFE77C|nr:isoaspartyl peptidase/L-asparaginase-like [Labrus mixtus]